MSRPIVFGEIPGIDEGYWFKGRKEMMPSSFHRSWVYGIDGNEKDGTSAIVLSALHSSASSMKKSEYELINTFWGS